VNVGLDCLADMFQMEDDYDNGVVVADMSSALPERQVDYGGPTTPTKQSVTTSPLSPEDRRGMSLLQQMRGTPPAGLKYVGARGRALVPASPPEDGESPASVEAPAAPIFRLKGKAAAFGDIDNDFMDVFRAESAPWFKRLESAHDRGKVGCNGGGAANCDVVVDEEGMWSEIDHSSIQILKSAPVVLRAQLRRQQTLQTDGKLYRRYGKSVSVPTQSMSDLELPEWWTAQYRSAVLSTSKREHAALSKLNASGDSADGSMTRGNMSADLSRRKSGVDLPRRSVIDTAHQKIVVATLVAEGVDEAAATELVKDRWSEGGLKNLATAWTQWLHYVAVMLTVGTVIDKLRPTPAQLVNFLRKVRTGEYRTGKMQGVMTRASWVRGVRSAISTTVSLWAQGPPIGAHPLVSGYITSIKNEDFQHLGEKGYRYDDTWDTEPLYDWIRKQSLTQRSIKPEVTGFSILVKVFRDVAVPMGRLAMACRSHDLTCIYRGIRSKHDTLRFHFANGKECPLMSSRQGLLAKGGEPPAAEGKPQGPWSVTGVSVRFYGPKQRHSLAVRSHGYTDWITVDAVEDAAVCFASSLYWYVRASEAMPTAIKGDKLFVASTTDKREQGRHKGLSSTTLANIMKKAMKGAKIPVEFKSHSARHAGIAQGRAMGMTDEALMARSNMSRPTFVKYYSRQVRRAVYTPQVVGFKDDTSAITEEKEESMLAELSDDGEA
jgi:hypothetical protein